MSTFRDAIAKFQSDFLTKGEIALERPEIITAGRCILRLVLGMILSGAKIFDNYAPFGIALVATSGAGIEGLSALAGTSIGYLAGMGLIGGLKYTAACVLVYAAAYVFNDIRTYKKSWFMPIVASFMSACTGFVYAVDAGWGLATTVFFMTETILVGGCTYFYKIALTARIIDADDEAQEIKTAVSMLLLGATCLISVNKVTVFGDISIGRVMAQLAVMIIAFKTSMGIGCSTGVAMGLAMDSCSSLGAPFYSMAYGFSGLLAGVFGRKGRFVFMLAFILSNCVSVLWTWQSVLQVSILYETFIASVVFMILPTKLMSKVSLGAGGSVSYYGAVKARERSQKRVESLSGAFKQLYVTAGKTGAKSENYNDVATIFDRAAEKCCRGCGMKVQCWNISYGETLDAMNKATGPMMERGHIEVRDFPEYFTESCKNLEGFINAINEEVRAHLYRKQFQSRLKESHETALEQYSDMSDILKELAVEMSTSITFEPYAERKLRKYLKTLDIEAQTAAYRDRNGRLHAEIKSEMMGALTRDKEYLNSLSALMNTRLCEKRDDNADELVLMEAEPLAAAVGIASVRKKGEAISGDRGSYFKTEEGILYVILADGMGSGSEAAVESETAVSILEWFLKAGLKPEAALRVFNSAITVRNEVSTGYATVDLLGINLFTGEAKIFKCGAAPSYVKKGKIVKKIKGESLAAGVLDKRSSMPDETAVKLEPGHFAIIASDGVSVEGDDLWLKEVISEYRGAEPKELAKCIIQKAMGLYGSNDDMTVLTVFLEERS